MSGPNGSIKWLNCGIEGGGWNPPNFGVDQVITKKLRDVIYNAPYTNCGPYIDAFEQAAGAHNVPAILLAAIAMQESSCNPGATGGNGEVGLMQITPDKCPQGHDGGDCRDPGTNIDIGARFLRDTLDGVNGNLPEAVGTYNGWHRGMTYYDATRARQDGNCLAQNNLDYLHQTFNGWMQGVDPRNNGMAVYNNLAGC
jgi:hypothetical protein